MSEDAAFDAELIRNILQINHQDETEKKINRTIKRAILLKVIVPVAITGAAVAVSSYLSRKSDETVD